MINNRLSLIGRVINEPKRVKSPNGIEHCHFLLEHRSEQKENQFSRQVWCRMPIQVSGFQLITKTQSITVGCNLMIVGFINSHKTSKGLYQLVLHAEQVEFID